MAHLIRDGVALGFDEVGRGTPAVLLVHGIACSRAFWPDQVRHLAPNHRVLAVDLRGHGESDSPHQQYTIQGFADDLAWMCAELNVNHPIVVGHSLGGLVALELAVAYPDRVAAAVLVDSVLLAGSDRAKHITQLVAGLRGPKPQQTLRDYFAKFFSPYDDPVRQAWILDQVVRTAPHVASSVWEQSLTGWDDAAALKICRVPLLYLDAGTPNADLRRAKQLRPNMMIGQTIGSGHFSPLEVPDQVNAMITRFLNLVARHAARSLGAP